MKKSNILSIIIILVICIFSSCDDADYGIKNNNIYISDATTSDAKMMVIEGDTEIGINVRLAKKVDYDVELHVRLNPQTLEAYNNENVSEYNFVPEMELPNGGKVVIPAGEIGVVYRVPLADFDMKGKRYGFAVVLESSKGESIGVSETLSKYVYLLTKPLITSVPIMRGAGSKLVRTAPETDWGITTNEWSLEALVYMSGYRKNNQAIFNLGSKDHEIYIRFGDANSPYNYLQIKTLGGQVDTKRDLEAGKWYHWAFVYDGTTLTIYRDGEFNTKFDPPAPAGGVVRMDYVEMISSGSYFVDNCKMSQVRLWNKAISQTQIKNNMHFSVDPENKDLIGYWPMGEGEGNSFADITGNGHDATADSGILQGWEHNIRFDK